MTLPRPTRSPPARYTAESLAKDTSAAPIGFRFSRSRNACMSKIWLIYFSIYGDASYFPTVYQHPEYIFGTLSIAPAARSVSGLYVPRGNQPLNLGSGLQERRSRLESPGAKPSERKKKRRRSPTSPVAAHRRGSRSGLQETRSYIGSLTPLDLVSGCFRLCTFLHFFSRGLRPSELLNETPEPLAHFT